MNTFLKFVAAIITAAGVIFLAMKVIESIQRSEKDNERIAMLKGKIQLPKKQKGGRLKNVADKFTDEIADFRDSDDDDDLFADLKDFSKDAADSAAEAVEEIADAVEEIAEDIADEAEDAAEELADLSEESLDQLLDSDN